MNRKLLIGGISVLVIVAAALALVIGKGTHTNIIGNEEVISEVVKVEGLSRTDFDRKNNITAADLHKLKRVTSGDHFASHYVQEIEWMVANNLSEHVLHSTGLLKDYLRTGVEIACVPHELWHMALFTRHNQTEMAEHKAEELEQEYPEWIASMERKAKSYPAYYKGLNQTKQEVELIISRLKQGDWGEENLLLMEKVGDEGVC